MKSENLLNRNLVSFILMLLMANTAQTQDPTVISSASGQGKTANIALSWTLGETAVSSGHTLNRWYTEGFHQPNLLVYPSMTKDDKVQIEIAPNPAHSTIRIQIQPVVPSEMLIFLNDVKGRRILNSRLAPGIHQTLLNVEGIAPGIYFLQIRNSLGNVFESFKIIKL